jgi:hypothetical protein
MKSRRVILNQQPFDTRDEKKQRANNCVQASGPLPGSTASKPATAVGLRLSQTITLDTAATIRVHVTADNRYELFADGEFVGRGSERGDERNWFFETYELELGAGEHTLVARAWR